jgi:hypothetical protein
MGWATPMLPHAAAAESETHSSPRRTCCQGMLDWRAARRSRSVTEVLPTPNWFFSSPLRSQAPQQGFSRFDPGPVNRPYRYDVVILK